MSTTTPNIHIRPIATVPLYGGTCDLCPSWVGERTDDLDAHMEDVRAHARMHPNPTAGAPWTPGSVAPRPVTRGVEVGTALIYGVICDECPRYEGPASADRHRVDEYAELHRATHTAHQRLRAKGYSSQAIAAHRAAVQADPGRWARPSW
ncbi:hypothetical protein [Streptomyces parvus]|uniref:hypothetical protein n=1 Tax=Streptomyces parvus TaxID=66428 RepID=UPI0034031A74